MAALFVAEHGDAAKGTVHNRFPEEQAEAPFIYALYSGGVVGRRPCEWLALEHACHGTHLRQISNEPQVTDGTKCG